MEQIREKAIIVGIQLQNETNFAYSMEELSNLAVACDLEVVGGLVKRQVELTPPIISGQVKSRNYRHF